MNDLTQYRAVKDQIRPGDLIVFLGRSPLSWLIWLFASGPSHVAPVRQGSHHGSDVTIIESTINGDRDGVQTNPLEPIIAGYDGAIAWLPLTDEIHNGIDWQEFYRFCGSAEDFISYDIGGLVEFLARDVPVIGPRVGQEQHTDKMVCSGWAVALYKTSGKKIGLMRGINWSEVSPQDLIEMKLFKKLVPLVGTPRLRRFNSV
jgi:hypothetical protein